jgi:hypothetical protein
VRDHASWNEGEDVKRRFFAVLSVLSSVLFVATAILWVRSYGRSDVIGNDSAPRGFIFATAKGELEFVVMLHQPVQKISSPKFVWRIEGPYSLRELAKEVTVTQVVGFTIFHDPPRPIGSTGDKFWAIALPCWFVMALTAFPAASLIRNRLRRSALRQRLNLCVKCGYDLRATPDRCPECGTAPTKPMVTT